MFRFGKVSFVLFFLAVSVSSDDYLSHWGLHEVDSGFGLIFDGIYTLKIRVLPPIHDQLDCKKYASELLNPDKGINGKSRQKRESDENLGLLVEDELLCRYKPSLNQSDQASKNEERDWLKLVEQQWTGD